MTFHHFRIDLGGAFAGHVGSSWRYVGACWPSWSNLACFWDHLGVCFLDLGAILVKPAKMKKNNYDSRPLSKVFGLSGVLLDAMLAHLGAMLGHAGAILAIGWTLIGDLGADVGAS